jgi:hypothetical protein
MSSLGSPRNAVYPHRLLCDNGSEFCRQRVAKNHLNEPILIV